MEFTSHWKRTWAVLAARAVPRRLASASARRCSRCSRRFRCLYPCHTIECQSTRSHATQSNDTIERYPCDTIECYSCYSTPAYIYTARATEHKYVYSRTAAAAGSAAGTPVMRSNASQHSVLDHQTAPPCGVAVEQQRRDRHTTNPASSTQGTSTQGRRRVETRRFRNKTVQMLRNKMVHTDHPAGSSG